jgi:uncharacterized membrane protein YedE/YeeE
MEFELSTIHKVALLGFLCALVVGAVVNKTHFCIMGSISDWVNFDSRTRFRAWMLAIGIAVLGTQIMNQLGWIDVRQSVYLTTNFGWIGYIVGGFLFGIGMTLGAGCGQRTLVRVGSGNLKSLFLFLVLAVSSYMTMRGVIAVFRVRWVDAANLDFTLAGLADQGIPTLISAATGLSLRAMQILVAAVVGLGTIWYALKDVDFRKSFDNILGGVVVGGTIVASWYITGVIGNDGFEPVPLEAMTFIGPSGNALNYLMTYTGAIISFGVAVVFGVVLGSFLYAKATGNFRIETFTSKQDMINHLTAGVLMGTGGVLALGCTIGQGVTGLSTLALGSLLTLFFIVAGGAMTVKVQYHMLDESFPRAVRLALADFRLMPALRQATSSS